METETPDAPSTPEEDAPVEDTPEEAPDGDEAPGVSEEAAAEVEKQAEPMGEDANPED